MFINIGVFTSATSIKKFDEIIDSNTECENIANK